MSNARVFTEQDEKVLKMLSLTAKKVEKIREPVDVHKRFNENDYKDPYGQVIQWVHFVGTALFRD